MLECQFLNASRPLPLYCRGSCDDMPLYLFDSGFAEKAPRLAGDYTVRSGYRVASGCVGRP